jgi:hypothetical protein
VIRRAKTLIYMRIDVLFLLFSKRLLQLNQKIVYYTNNRKICKCLIRRCFLMKLKGFIVTFGSFALTTAFLYLLGYVFTIPWLMLQYEYTDNASGFFVSIGSLVPLIIGLLISFIAEKIYIYKHRQKLG